jgi:hypothetical protein
MRFWRPPTSEGVWTPEPAERNGRGWSPCGTSRPKRKAPKKFMVIRPRRESTKGWTRRPERRERQFASTE